MSPLAIFTTEAANIGPVPKLPQLFVAVLLASISLPGHASAKIELCRQIEKRLEREACYKRQDEARIAAQKAAAARPKAPPFDAVSAENDRAAAKLRSICKGC